MYLLNKYNLIQSHNQIEEEAALTKLAKQHNGYYLSISDLIHMEQPVGEWLKENGASILKDHSTIIIQNPEVQADENELGKLIYQMDELIATNKASHKKFVIATKNKAVGNWLLDTNYTNLYQFNSKTNDFELIYRTNNRWYQPKRTFQDLKILAPFVQYELGFNVKEISYDEFSNQLYIKVFPYPNPFIVSIQNGRIVIDDNGYYLNNQVHNGRNVDKQLAKTFIQNYNFSGQTFQIVNNKIQTFDNGIDVRGITSTINVMEMMLTQLVTISQVTNHEPVEI